MFLCLNWYVEIGRTASRDVRSKFCLGEEGNGPVGPLSDRRISEYGNEHHRRILVIQARRIRTFERARNI